MDNYIKIIAFVLLAVVLIQMTSKTDRDISVLLNLAACSIAVIFISPYVSRVFDFMKELQQFSGIDGIYMSVLMKSLAVGLLTEIAVLVCNDSGNSALGRSLQIAGIGVVLWLSIPAFEALLKLIKDFLGGV